MSTSISTPPVPLRVLLLGAGGREHALAHHLLSSRQLEKLYICPGNGSIGALSGDGRVENISFPGQASGDWKSLVEWSVGNRVNLVVPGPEQPLVDGVEKAFRDGE